MTQETKMLLGIGLTTVLIIIAGVLFLGGNKNSSTPGSIDKTLLVRSDSHKIATDSAKLIIVEFGDYQCPACGQAHPVVKKILNDYQGKISFVFRNFPLPLHKNALVAAEAAEAAFAQDKFWQMYDKLYEGQSAWAESDRARDVFTSYAKELGMDVAKFQSDVSGNKFAGIIKQDQDDGNKLRVMATPTFFMNDQKIEGALNYTDFKNKIDTELGKK